MNTQNTEFILILLFIFILFSIWITINLLLPHPLCVYKHTHTHKNTDTMYTYIYFSLLSSLSLSTHTHTHTTQQVIILGFFYHKNQCTVWSSYWDMHMHEGTQSLSKEYANMIVLRGRIFSTIFTFF